MVRQVRRQPRFDGRGRDGGCRGGHRAAVIAFLVQDIFNRVDRFCVFGIGITSEGGARGGGVRGRARFRRSSVHGRARVGLERRKGRSSCVQGIRKHDALLVGRLVGSLAAFFCQVRYAIFLRRGASVDGVWLN